MKTRFISICRIQYAGQYGIIRNNIFHDQVGPSVDLTYYTTEAAYCHDTYIYHNVFYKSSFAGVTVSSIDNANYHDQSIKNNIFLKNVFVRNDMRHDWYEELDGKPVAMMIGTGAIEEDLKIKGNCFWNIQKGEKNMISEGTKSGGVTNENIDYFETLYPTIISNSIQMDPEVVDEVNHDFTLQKTSGLIESGVFLTTVSADVTNSNFLNVVDAYYFYDGFGIDGELGDTIRIEGIDEKLQIVDINYDTKVIELDQSISWSIGDGVSMYFEGTKPNVGLYEAIETTNDKSDASQARTYISLFVFLLFCIAMN